MAKPSWLTVSPMSGSGNDTLRNTATEQLRIARTLILGVQLVLVQ